MIRILFGLIVVAGVFGVGSWVIFGPWDDRGPWYWRHGNLILGALLSGVWLVLLILNRP